MPTNGGTKSAAQAACFISHNLRKANKLPLSHNSLRSSSPSPIPSTHSGDGDLNSSTSSAATTPTCYSDAPTAPWPASR